MVHPLVKNRNFRFWLDGRDGRTRSRSVRRWDCITSPTSAGGGGGLGSAAAARHSRTLHLAKYWLAGSLQMVAYQIRPNRGRGLSLRNKALFFFSKTLSNLFLFFFLARVSYGLETFRKLVPFCPRGQFRPHATIYSRGS